jgi:hypothetical protein
MHDNEPPEEEFKSRRPCETTLTNVGWRLLVKGCQMPTLLRKAARRDRTWWAGVGQPLTKAVILREELVNHNACESSKAGDLEGNFLFVENETLIFCLGCTK